MLKVRLEPQLSICHLNPKSGSNPLCQIYICLYITFHGISHLSSASILPHQNIGYDSSPTTSIFSQCTQLLIHIPGIRQENNISGSFCVDNNKKNGCIALSATDGLATILTDKTFLNPYKLHSGYSELHCKHCVQIFYSSIADSVLTKYVY